MTAVLCTLIATFLVQLGYFLWKISANTGKSKIGQDSVISVLRNFLTDWRFIGGLCAVTLGWVLFIQATTMGDITLVQPLMSGGGFLLVLMAVIFLKERLTKFEWIGVCISICGSIALVIEVENSLTTAFNAVYFYSVLGSMAIAACILWFINRKIRRPEIFLSLIIGLCFGAGAILTKAMAIRFSAINHDIMTWGTLLDPFIYGVIGANVMGLVLLQAVFQKGRASVVVPVQIAITNVATVLGGVLIFAEHITFFRALGIVLIICGTFFIETDKKVKGA